MEREHRAAVATFFAPGDWGARVTLPDGAAHHALVKRLGVGDTVRISSGDGRLAVGQVAELGKGVMAVAIDATGIELVAAPPYVELWAPVGDRERMLMLAEKAAELQVSAWRSVGYARSRSVSPRGEGEAFMGKLKARQIGALEQSGGAWLPRMLGESSLDAALAGTGTAGAGHLLLDAGGVPLRSAHATVERGVCIALGPEGGLDDTERAAFLQRGWHPVSLGANVLRFETAAIAALAILRQPVR